MSKVILLKVGTGFQNCVHEEEIEYTGQSEGEIAELLSDFREEVVCNYIEATYEIEDEDKNDGS